MKKTLIALAALAATGAFAQVTVTGELAMGYAATTNTAGAQASGFGVDTSKVDFTASEDLGGGWKSIAVFGLDGASRAGPVTADDAKLTLVTPGGAFTLISFQALDYLSNSSIANVSQSLNDWGGWGTAATTPFFATASAPSSGIIYTVPVGPVKLGFANLDFNFTGTGTTPALGTAAAGEPFIDQRLNEFSATYASGPLAAQVAYLNWDNQGATLGAKNVSRIAASYDFGVAKIGGGISDWSLVSGTNNQALISIDVPVGSFDLGANWVSEQNSGTTAAGTTVGINDSRSGYELSVAYNFSKKTSIQGQYMSYQGSGYGASAAANTTTTVAEVALVKNF